MTSAAPLTDEQRAVQQHLARLYGALYRPVARAVRLSLATGALVLGAGVGLLVAEAPPRVTFGVALAILVAGLAIAWSFLLRPSTRRAMRLVMAHDLHERKGFERATGGRMPRGERAMARWLAEHPGELGGFSVLVALGRLDEAERLLDAAARADADERFQDARARALLALLRDQVPDVALLESRLGDIRDPDRYQHRSACLAIVRAELAIDRGEPPIPILAAAEARVGPVGPPGAWATGLAATTWLPFLAFALVSLVAASQLP